ncbi:MAG: exodeoxyribonuclease VII small subunit [Chlamydiia bacterium]|nr:exodeoxyribonuclease VII small subunit [Chlamydiia bacterium]
MNRGEISLDDALTLYEEADTLICSSSKRLAQAEKKIEQLIKQRDGTTISIPLDPGVTMNA